MNVPGDVLACLPCPAKGHEWMPNVPTLWSTGSSVYKMAEQRAIRRGRSRLRAAQKATEASRQYSRAMASIDPKLWRPCCVKVVALKVTTGTNTESLAPVQQSAVTDTSDLPALDGSVYTSVSTLASPELEKDSRSPGGTRTNRGPRCFNCHSSGHRQKKCPMPRQKFCRNCGATNPNKHRCQRPGNPY